MFWGVQKAGHYEHMVEGNKNKTNLMKRKIIQAKLERLLAENKKVRKVNLEVSLRQ